MHIIVFASMGTALRGDKERNTAMISTDTFLTIYIFTSY